MKTSTLSLVLSLSLTPSLAFSKEDKPQSYRKNRCATKLLKYPEYPKLTVVDKVQGQNIEDPYRGLEDTTSLKTQKWVNAQNRLTSDYLSPTIDTQKIIQNRYEKLFANSRVDWLATDEKGEPLKIGKHYYFQFHEAGATGIWAVMRTLDPNDIKKAEMLVSSVQWGGPMQHLVTLGEIEIIQDGKYLVYSIGKFGSDWNETFVLDLKTKKQVDHFPLLKGGMSISADEKQCIYAQYPAPDQKYIDRNKRARLMLHTFGKPISEDKVLYVDKDLKQGELGGYLVEQTNEIFVDVIDPRYKGNAVLKRAVSGNTFEPLIPHSYGADFHHVLSSDKGYWFITNYKAPNRKLIFVPKDSKSDSDWITIIDEDKEGYIESIHPAGPMLVANLVMGVVSVAKLYDTKGKFMDKITPPGPGSMSGFHAVMHEKELVILFEYEDLGTPSTKFGYLTEKKQLVLAEKPSDHSKLKDYVYEHTTYKSSDGTLVPIQLFYHKDTKRDGTAPVYLHAYGGFGVNTLPEFSSKWMTWAEMGGIVAIPNIRGGAEMGGDWHLDGSMLNKQNSFNDFISAAEWLISEKYTTAKRIGIEGGSNGGLLVAACLLQRPDLFGAAIPGVGVYDMIRFQKFTRGFHWINEYGTLRRKEEVQNMLTYSPVHNVKPGVEYPPTLIVTGNKDDLVSPVHSYKFAAALQEAQKGSNPILLRVNANSAHGPGTRLEYIKQLAEELAFFIEMLGMDLPPAPKQTSAKTPQQ